MPRATSTTCGLPRGRRPAPAVRDRDGRRRRRQVPAPPAVPLRDRHALVGTARARGSPAPTSRRPRSSWRRRSRRTSASPTPGSSARTCTTCPPNLDGTFDVVYTSRGVLGWLPDIRGWAAVVAHFLAPGGTFFITEAHPVFYAFDDEGVAPGELRLRVPVLRAPGAAGLPGPGLLRGPGRRRRRPGRARLGPRPRRDRHRPDRRRPAHRAARRAPVPRLGRADFLVEGPDGNWRLPPETRGELPLMFSLRATKPAG